MMLTTAQSEILQQFLTMPAPAYAQIFEAQGERDELAEELETRTNERDAAIEDCHDARLMKDDDDARIRELEAALADALSIIAGDVLPSDLAETDKAFRRLYKVL